MASSSVFTRDEVVIHNTWYDIWVIVNGRVLDLTNFVAERANSLNDSLCLLIKLAGKDLSHYFNERGEPLIRVNQLIRPVPVYPPVCEKASDEHDFWWRDKTYEIGTITRKQRHVRIINTMTRKTVMLSVCEEDSIETIKEKYTKLFNNNADGYVWRKTCTTDSNPGTIFMDKTLTQNNILFELHEKRGLPPALWLFYVLNKD